MQQDLHHSIKEASELLERVTQIIYAFRLNPNYVPEDLTVLNKFEQLAFVSRETANTCTLVAECMRLRRTRAELLGNG